MPNPIRIREIRATVKVALKEGSIPAIITTASPQRYTRRGPYWSQTLPIAGWQTELTRYNAATSQIQVAVETPQSFAMGTRATDIMVVFIGFSAGPNKIGILNLAVKPSSSGDGLMYPSPLHSFLEPQPLLLHPHPCPSRCRTGLRPRLGDRK